jgi:hypothetical protein
MESEKKLNKRIKDVKLGSDKLIIEHLESTLHAVKHDRNLMSMISTSKILSELNWCSPIFCAFSIGTGNWVAAGIFYVMYAVSFLIVRSLKGKIRHRLDYLSMLNMGEQAKSRWDA